MSTRPHALKLQAGVHAADGSVLPGRDYISANCIEGRHGDDIGAAHDRHTLKLTFMHMCVTKHTVEKKILRGVSGMLKPRTITLVLSHPGSGKSSLVKILYGDFWLTGA